mgnify:CR=1 FL=1|jgi:hypothetical protein
MEFPRVQDFILTIQQAVSKKPRLVNRADDLCRVIHNTYPDVKIITSNGASKECLVFPELGYVLKWSMETRDAEREVAVYQKAVDANLADFFPATMLAGYIVPPRKCDNPVAFTAQQIINTSAHKIHWSKGGLKTRLSRIAQTVPDCRISQIERQFRKADVNGYGRDLDGLWAKVAVSIYGKRKVIALCEFVKKYHINDLHGSNIGYIGIFPVILDFSGYGVCDGLEF